MVIKFSPGKIFITLLFFLNLSQLIAQDLRYYQEQRFVQRLAWKKEEYALQYELLIDRNENGVYRRHLRETTRELFIELSLAPGKYRYGVIAFDLLGRRGNEPDWRLFEVFPAIRPELNSFSPASHTLNEKEQLEITLSGRNIVEGAEISLRRLDIDVEPLIPVKVIITGGGSEVSLAFDSGQLAPGIYEIYVKNPGGLDSSIRRLTVMTTRAAVRERRNQEEAKIDLYLGAAWRPSLPVYGEMDRVFGRNFYLNGAMMRFGAFSTRPSFINLGMEFSASWQSLDNTFEGDDTSLQSVLIEYNILAQKWFNQRTMAVSLRAGIGTSLPISITEKDPYVLEAHVIHANAGISFIYAFMHRFYIEAGADFSFFFAVDNPSGVLRPSIGAGILF